MNLKTQASEETKRKIVQTAIAILGTEGYPALTVGKLSAQAGISKGALYHHYESLDDVRLAVLETLIEQVVVIKDPEEFASLADYLDDMGEEHFALMKTKTRRMKAVYAFLAQGIFEEEAGSHLLKMMQDSLEECDKSFRHFCPDASEEKLESVHLLIDAFFIGMMSQWFLGIDRDQCRESWNCLSQILVHFFESPE